MTGIPGFNVQAFNRAESVLSEFGHICFNPANKPMEGWTWNDYMKRDIKALMDCDVVILIEGWESSKGSVLEGFIASEVGMELYTLDKFVEMNRGGIT